MGLPPAREKGYFRGVGTRMGYRAFECQVGCSDLPRCVATESSHLLVAWTAVLTVCDEWSSSYQQSVSASTVISWYFYRVQGLWKISSVLSFGSSLAQLQFRCPAKKFKLSCGLSVCLHFLILNQNKIKTAVQLYNLPFKK